MESLVTKRAGNCVGVFHESPGTPPGLGVRRRSLRSRRFSSEKRAHRIVWNLWVSRRQSRESLRSSCSFHAFRVNERQSQRDCASKPSNGVASLRATQEKKGRETNNPNGVAIFSGYRRRNPVGVDTRVVEIPQGSSFLAILGFRAESRWDSNGANTFKEQPLFPTLQGAGVQIRNPPLSHSVQPLELR